MAESVATEEATGAVKEQEVPREAAEPSGLRKAAVLLISLGIETASEVLRHMNEKEVEAVSIEIARTENVSSDVIETVLTEYQDMSMAQEYITQGGKTFAREALIQAVGEKRAEEIMIRIEAATEVSAFHQLQTVETSQLTNFIQEEHPQTAALILSHLNPRKAADILSGLNEKLQAEIMYRLASMDKTSPDLVEEVEEVIRQKMDAVFGAELSSAGGEEVAAAILNAINRNSERVVLDEIRSRDPELANGIKSLMFVFDDLKHLEDRDIQRLLAEVDQKDLALALKAVPTELEEKMLNNLSSRVAEMVREEVELLGRVRVSDVDEAQNNIMEVARMLEDEEEISLAQEQGDFIS